MRPRPLLGLILACTTLCLLAATIGFSDPPATTAENHDTGSLTTNSLP